ncbi:MAG: sensor histidine kinase, partial [Waterburya sp.]
SATLKEQEIARWFEDQQRDFLQTTQMPDVQNSLNILLNSSLTAEKQQAYQVLAQYLTRVNQIKPSLREIFILDRSNKIIFSTNKKREGDYEILANITYVEQVEIGANFAPIFYVSPVTGKPAITLAKPLKNRSGMVLVDLDLERIDRIVREKTGLGASGETYLVGSLISKNSFLAGKSDSSKAFPDGVNSPGIDAAMSGMSGYGLYRNYSQSPVLGVYRWLNEQDIALLVEISQEEAFDAARKLASTIMLVGLISVLWLLVGVNWLSQQLFLSRQQLEKSSQQLQLKAQEAEAANRAKSLFLANMSHELRTPLNAILGFSQLMARDTNISPDHQQSLDIINRSGEHLLNLINDVLEMSKIEAGKITLNTEPFDLYQLLQTIQEMFQAKAEAKGLWLKFILANNLPQYIVSDSRKVRQ